MALVAEMGTLEEELRRMKKTHTRCTAHTVRLARGGLLIPCTVCGTGMKQRSRKHDGVSKMQSAAVGGLSGKAEQLMQALEAERARGDALEQAVLAQNEKFEAEQARAHTHRRRARAHTPPA